MTKATRQLGTLALALALAPAGAATLGADSPPPGIGKPQSMSSKVGGFFKSGADKAKGVFTSKPDEPVDPLLAKNKQKPGPELHVALAQMHERTGKFEEAEAEYKKALKAAPGDRGAMVGYAHLKDRQNELNEAIALYKAAVAKHPKDAPTYNDLGLCYHRRGLLRESTQSLRTAVELKPDKVLYRNNLATVLVEQGDIAGALVELKAAHGAAAAHYNLGYLLHRKGDDEAALTQFQLALAENPTMAQAHNWIARLAPAAPMNGQGALGPQISQAQPNTYRPNVRPMPRMEQPANQVAAPEPPAASPYYLRAREVEPAAAPLYGNRNPVQYPQRRDTADASDAVPPTPSEMPPISVPADSSGGPILPEALPPVE